MSTCQERSIITIVIHTTRKKKRNENSTFIASITRTAEKRSGMVWKKGESSFMECIHIGVFFPVGNLHPSASLLKKNRAAVASSSEELQLVLMAFLLHTAYYTLAIPSASTTTTTVQKYMCLEILLEEDECCFVRELLFSPHKSFRTHRVILYSSFGQVPNLVWGGTSTT